MKKLYALSNALTFILAIYVNYTIGIEGFRGSTIQSVSAQYSTLLTPAGYAFAIWGIIYFGLIWLVIYQINDAFFNAPPDFKVLEVGPWLTISNICNALWVMAWLREQLLLSVFIMLLLLYCLLRIVVNTRMQLVEVPVEVKIFLHWPIAIYAGWISVAFATNVASYAAYEWIALVWSEEIWTILVLLLVTSIFLYVVRRRSMFAFGWVGVWSLTAIAVRHWNEIPVIQWMAVLGGSIIFIMIVSELLFSDRS